MPLDYALRPATEDDREFFFALRREALGQYIDALWGWDEEEQRRNAAREFGRHPFQIIEQGGRRVGYLCVVHDRDHDYLEEIALAPEVRGTGLGTAVLADVMADARRREVPVRLSVLTNNPARKLYERLGFGVYSIDPPRVRMEWPPVGGRTAHGRAGAPGRGASGPGV